MFSHLQALVFHIVSLITALIYFIVIILQLKQFKTKELERLKITLLTITVAMFVAMVISAIFYWLRYREIDGYIQVIHVGFVNRVAFLIAAIGWLLVYTKFSKDK